MFGFIALTGVLRAAIAATALAQPAAPDAQPVVVVELFTSQTCPMCPGANALLGELSQAQAEHGEVLALAYGVSYWNLFGWRDRYAQPEFNARQRAYVDAGEARRVFTPHFVVNGAPQLIRYEPDTVREAVLSAPAAPVTARLVPEADSAQLEVGASEGAFSVWRVSYTPGEETMAVEGGPNRGKIMSHYNMVRDISRVGDWRPDAPPLQIEAPQAGEAVAVLLQAGEGGPIVAAARYPAP
jgi:hypothetical protein